MADVSTAIITDLTRARFPQKPLALTIGNFDGVHLGHLALLERMREFLPREGIRVVYTFTNHPSHVLSPNVAIPYIYTLEHKLKILEELGVDYIILSPFTETFARTPYRPFLEELKKSCDFSYLVLGKGAVFGKNKEGDEKAMQRLVEEWAFRVEYLPKIEIEGAPLSSGRIRTLIAEGKFAAVKQCLGRPYSIYAPLLVKEKSHHLEVKQLCLPPSGEYSVEVKLASTTYFAKAQVNRPSSSVRLFFEGATPTPSLVEVVF